MGNEGLKKIGFYLLLALVVLRFGVVPLRASVAEQKALFESHAGSYRAKAALVARQAAHGGAVRGEPGPPVAVGLYPADAPVTAVQSELLKAVVGYAERKGLSVVSFELSDPEPHAHLGEVPVAVRLSGGAGPAVDLLGHAEAEGWSIRRFQAAKGAKDIVFDLTLSAFMEGR